jgi:RNA polymerase sigma-54 factor
MNFKPRLIQTQQTKLTLTPKLIQMFNIFHLSYQDLVDHVNEVHDENVFIEITQSDSLLSKKGSSASQERSHNQAFTELIADQEFKSIRDFAHSQCEYHSCSDIQKKIISYLIDSLDDRGFIENWSKVNTFIQSHLKAPRTAIKKSLEILQEFEPDGIGARSLSECLAIQINHLELENNDLKDLLLRVVNHHLDDLAQNNYEVIAKTCSIPLEGVSPLAEFIKTNLNPNPGQAFTNHQATYITPSFAISYENDRVLIKNLESDKGLSITLSETYLKQLHSKSLDEKTKAFLTEKHQQAKAMIDCINQRREMMNTLLTHIAKKQALYIQKGPKFLVPLLQKDVANELKISTSTVSRILSSKFCETPYGIVPLSILCPRNYYGKTKEQFNHFIEYYLKNYPKYSDQKICNLLKEQGISIARRTVTKYRHHLGLDSSYFKGRSS